MRRRSIASAEAMYKINCDECGQIGFHPSRVAAEARAERHVESTAGTDPDGDGHDCGVEPMQV